MSAEKLYVIGNSHMDPVWLWRLREGRSTWLNTCRSIVRIMKQFPMLKFCRSSSSCYEWIEQCDPALFEEIRTLVKAGRWEIVGGWVEQSDAIITPAEVLYRQAEYGQRYFKEKFGRTASIGYSVDAFGQNAGLPKILSGCGMNRYVFMRPQAHEKKMPDLFRWRGDDGSCVTTFRVQEAYCTIPGWKKGDLLGRVDRLLENGERHQTFFFGIGDHGGGIYEHQMEWLLQAAETRPIEFTTLDEYFNAVEKTELPELSGELTHHAPGCYAAVSSVKRDLAVTERALYKAEKLLLESNDKEDRKELDRAWNEYLFNYFHDIYPGTATRISYEREVRDLTGFACKIATDQMEKKLSRYGASIQSDFLTEGGVLVWNPLPRPVRALISFDTFGDPNCTGKNFNRLTGEDGKSVPLQWLRAAVSYGPNQFWGRATAVVELPASGLKALAYGRGKESAKKLGFERQKAALERFRFPVIADTGDTWGHAVQRLGRTVGYAKLTGTEELADGPAASVYRATFRYRKSTFRLDLFAYDGIPELFCRLFADWHEHDGTLKLALLTGIRKGSILSGQAGCTLRRKPDDCEQPFIDFVAATDERGNATGFLADSLHSYDSTGSADLRLTLLRPVVYAEHVPSPPHGDEGYADLGEVQQEFWFFDKRKTTGLPAAAQERLWGAEHLEITAASDGKKFKRPKYEVTPDCVIALSQSERGFRLWNSSEKSVKAVIKCDRKEVAEAELAPGEIRMI